jgi:Amt family ammonium transporter
VLLRIVDALLGLRDTAEQETQGLDLSQHDARGYDL